MFGHSFSIRIRHVLLFAGAVLLIVLIFITFTPGSDSSNPGSSPKNMTQIVDFPDNTSHLIPMIARNQNIDPFYPSLASTGGKVLSMDMFDRSEVCAACHQQIYEQWKNSVMAHSWEDPIYRALLRRASIATGGAVDNLCIGCHSPVGLTTGTAGALEEREAQPAPGVDCESCHNMSGSTGLGNGGYLLTPMKFGRKLKFGPRRDAQSPYHDTAYSQLHTQSEFCATCHNVTHPFNRLPVERTYDEWRDSPYNGRGIHCQDCHMTPGPGVTTNPGKSAVMGRERPHIFTHYFTGGNVTLHTYFNQTEMADRARKMLQSVARMEFTELPQAIAPGEPATVKIQVANIGAGHKLPTGFPEGREIWIDFQVHDARGKEIYRLGRVQDGYTEEGTKSFKVVLADTAGHIVEINIWEAAQILTDTRILPGGFAEVDFYFPTPQQVHGPVTITANLNYWSFPQKLVDMLLGEGKLEVEIVRMTSITAEVPVVPSATTALIGE